VVRKSLGDAHDAQVIVVGKVVELMEGPRSNSEAGKEGGKEGGREGRKEGRRKGERTNGTEGEEKGKGREEENPK